MSAPRLSDDPAAFTGPVAVPFTASTLAMEAPTDAAGFAAAISTTGIAAVAVASDPPRASAPGTPGATLKSAAAASTAASTAALTAAAPSASEDGPTDAAAARAAMGSPVPAAPAVLKSPTPRPSVNGPEAAPDVLVSALDAMLVHFEEVRHDPRGRDGLHGDGDDDDATVAPRTSQSRPTSSFPAAVAPINVLQSSESLDLGELGADAAANEEPELTGYNWAIYEVDDVSLHSDLGGADDEEEELPTTEAHPDRIVEVDEEEADDPPSAASSRHASARQRYLLTPGHSASTRRPRHPHAARDASTTAARHRPRHPRYGAMLADFVLEAEWEAEATRPDNVWIPVSLRLESADGPEAEDAAPVAPYGVSPMDAAPMRAARLQRHGAAALRSAGQRRRGGAYTSTAPNALDARSLLRSVTPTPEEMQAMARTASQASLEAARSAEAAEAAEAAQAEARANAVLDRAAMIAGIRELLEQKQLLQAVNGALQHKLAEYYRNKKKTEDIFSARESPGGQASAAGGDAASGAAADAASPTAAGASGTSPTTASPAPPGPVTSSGTAANANPLASDRHASEQQVRYHHLLTEHDNLRQKLWTINAANEASAREQTLRLQQKKVEEKELRVALTQLRKQTSSKAEHSKTGQHLPAGLVDTLEANDLKKELEVAAVQLEHIKLRHRLHREEKLIRQKEELADGLHLIDFEQLKIENQTYNEKIEERNEELLKLRRKITSVVQIFAHVKEKLRHVQKEHTRLEAQRTAMDAQVLAHRDTLMHIKRRRDVLRQQSARMRQSNGLFGNLPLLHDYEAKCHQKEDLEQQIVALRAAYGQATQDVVEYKQKLYTLSIANLMPSVPSRFAAAPSSARPAI